MALIYLDQAIIIAGDFINYIKADEEYKAYIKVTEALNTYNQISFECRANLINEINRSINRLKIEKEKLQKTCDYFCIIQKDKAEKVIEKICSEYYDKMIEELRLQKRSHSNPKKSLLLLKK